MAAARTSAPDGVSAKTSPSTCAGFSVRCAAALAAMMAGLT